jgi:hypothetical protein
VGNELLRLGGEFWRDGIRLTRGGVYHGRHLSEVGASASSKSISTAAPFVRWEGQPPA